jgi:hypothetical protein
MNEATTFNVRRDAVLGVVLLLVVVADLDGCGGDYSRVRPSEEFEARARPVIEVLSQQRSVPVVVEQRAEVTVPTSGVVREVGEGCSVFFAGGGPLGAVGLACLVGIALPTGIIEEAVASHRAKHFQASIQDPITTVKLQLLSTLRDKASPSGIEWQDGAGECPGEEPCGSAVLLRLRTKQFLLDPDRSPGMPSDGSHGSAVYQAEARLVRDGEVLWKFECSTLPEPIVYSKENEASLMRQLPPAFDKLASECAAGLARAMIKNGFVSNE